MWKKIENYEYGIREFQCFYDLLLSIENPSDPLTMSIQCFSMFILSLIKQCHLTETQLNFISPLIEKSKHFIISIVEYVTSVEGRMDKH